MKLPRRSLGVAVALGTIWALGNAANPVYTPARTTGPRSGTDAPAVLVASIPPVDAGAILVGHHAGSDRGSVSRTGTPFVRISRTGTDDIPAVALTAYERAAQVMAAASPGCHLPWTLLAAVGRVESDHGRVGGSHLDTDGVARPAILGLPLNGRGPVERIRDTDGGALDHDTRWDRAVGPMQLIPDTWRVVAVDGDGDGVRNPEDIDDAALAAAVYLCGTGHDLANPAGMAAAAYRYNPSDRYVAIVLGYQRAYAAGSAAALVPGAVDQIPLLFEARTIESPGHVSGAASRPRLRHETTAQLDPVTIEPGAGTGSDPGTWTPPPTTPPTTSPTPDPTPDPTTDPTPAPTTDPTTDPTPAPTPTPDPSPPTGDPAAPAPTTLTGTWTACLQGYCVGNVVLDLGPAEQLARTSVADLDGDGTVETNADEFAGLVGQGVTLQVVTGSDATAVVQRIGDVEYRHADGTF